MSMDAVVQHVTTDCDLRSECDDVVMRRDKGSHPALQCTTTAHRGPGAAPASRG
jgi:hypothetical protein